MTYYKILPLRILLVSVHFSFHLFIVSLFVPFNIYECCVSSIPFQANITGQLVPKTWDRACKSSSIICETSCSECLPNPWDRSPDLAARRRYQTTTEGRPSFLYTSPDFSSRSRHVTMPLWNKHHHMLLIVCGIQDNNVAATGAEIWYLLNICIRVSL